MGSNYTLGMPPDSYGKGILLQSVDGGYTQYVQQYRYPAFLWNVDWTGAPTTANALTIMNTSALFDLLLVSLRFAQSPGSEDADVSTLIITERGTGYSGDGSAVTAVAMDSTMALPANIVGKKFATSITSAAYHRIMDFYQRSQSVDYDRIAAAISRNGNLLGPNAMEFPMVIRNNQCMSILISQSGIDSGTTSRLEAITLARPSV